jgi:hypothetical protein
MFIFIYLVFTIVIETTLLALLMGSWNSQKQIVFILANMCSWSVLHILWVQYDINIWFLEFSVTIFEALALFFVAKLALQKSFMFAFVTNSASLGIGILMNGLPQ